MSEIIINGEQMQPDEREKSADEIRHLIHQAADIAETAIRSEDKAVEDALRSSAKVLLQTALKKLDESVGTAVADETDDDE
jgi:hypothetical protein